MDKAKVNYSIKLRNFIGVMVMLLPVLNPAFILTFGAGHNPAGVLTSISATYYSTAAPFFFGLTIGTGVLLIFYDDYDIKDRIVTILAGAGLIILALFPCALPTAATWNVAMLPQNITNTIHLAGAFLFFACMVFIVNFQFTKTGEGAAVAPGSRKWRRNVLYRVCAGIMAVALIVGFGGSRLFGFAYLVYIGESVAFEALGVSWNTKGGLWLKDI